MKVAVLGPITRDEIIINNKKHAKLGGIPFYTGRALHSLGISCTLFITHAKEDTDLVKKQLKGLDIVHIYSEKTLVMRIKYEKDNPDKRSTHPTYTPCQISSDIINQLEQYDCIIMGPLFYGDIDPRLFELLSHKKVVLGNFGMFNYTEGNTMQMKHPERAIAVMSHVDFLFFDENEAKFVSERNTVKEAAKELLKYVDCVAITNGSKGSKIFTNKFPSKEFIIPAYPPKNLADPTGAGDTYLAGFITALDFLDNYQEIGEFAAMAATEKIEHKGPLMATREEILQRLGNE